MKIIHHRRNTCELLAATLPEHGVEIDLRSQGSQIIIHHDPFQAGIAFDRWLEGFHHGTLILNVKEEGLEEVLLATMSMRGIHDFFFLDQSFPFLVKTSSKGERRSAVRVSEFEGLTCARALAGSINWAWIDCFTRFPISPSEIVELKGLGYRLCLVSPELQGREPGTEVADWREVFSTLGVEIDAVCTKRPEIWS